MLSYAAALDYLFPRVTQIKFGLETTRELLALLGDPHLQVPVVHIGGTNGKGSVTALVSSALRSAGWRVGTYTSPHLVSFRERITVDGVPIGEEAVAMWTGRLMADADRLDATLFETTTAMAFADLAGFLRREAVPDRRRASEAELVDRVGGWIGRQVLGETPVVPAAFIG